MGGGGLMAGGIDWFRWHHGSVTDPKFQLVARKAGVRLGDVLAVWAYILEAASAATERGQFGEIDCEAVDCMLDMHDGATAAVLAAMELRQLTEGGAVTAWQKRQPKRERPEDDTAAERKRNQRARDAATEEHVTPRHATSHQKTPRGEESREEPSSPTSKKGARAAPAPQVDRPGDVAESVWRDWLALRKAKKAPVSPTVLDGAVAESAKAGMTLEAFLRVWVARGSQGLLAEWLKPHERPPPNGGETPRERAAREKVFRMSGGLMGAKPYGATSDIIDINIPALG